MSAPLLIDVVTIFPGMLKGFLGESMLRLAAEKNIYECRFVDPRDFTTDVHRTTDDRPYGGGPGMVMKPEPLFAAVESVRQPHSRVILLTPQGARYEQSTARRLAGESHLVLICGHYEGIDERVRLALADEELSIGDYILTNGVLAAAVVIDSVVRLHEGALGAADGAVEESFSDGLLEYPQYTRPAEFRGMQVPQVLCSGHHEEIRRWRQEKALERTRQRRPDLLQNNNEPVRAQEE